ncbi:hypothetical protein R3P38DRAFT_3376103 [Favolaschia claudopus]|uniref:Uncharacterized protein n=1 Tax=Favolaschia claudopus TaxID=2862362 RepID=A0AAV9ZHB7_9AGAR
MILSTNYLIQTLSFLSSIKPVLQLGDKFRRIRFLPPGGFALLRCTNLVGREGFLQDLPSIVLQYRIFGLLSPTRQHPRLDELLFYCCTVVPLMNSGFLGNRHPFTSPTPVKSQCHSSVIICTVFRPRFNSNSGSKRIWKDNSRLTQRLADSLSAQELSSSPSPSRMRCDSVYYWKNDLVAVARHHWTGKRRTPVDIHNIPMFGLGWVSCSVFQDSRPVAKKLANVSNGKKLMPLDPVK